MEASAKPPNVTNIDSRILRLAPPPLGRGASGPFAARWMMPINHQSVMTIVVIDDQASGRMLLTEILSGVDPTAKIEAFADVIEALTFAEENQVDLVITDYRMPKMDGIEAIRRLRKIPHVAEVPIICVTIVGEPEVKILALNAGATDYLTRPLDHLDISARCKNALALRHHQLNSHLYSQELERRIELATQQVRLEKMETLLRLAKVAEQRDSITGQHLVRIAKYSALLARECGWGEDDQYAMEISSPLHDIGKIGIPDSIIQAQRKLSEDELIVMKQHAEIGYRMLSGGQSRYLKIAAEIARSHHERFDGTGYPSKLAGEMIPLEARIVAVTDVYDALTSKRQYKLAWSMEETKAYMMAESGKHFDPELLQIFLKCADELEHIRLHFSDLT